MKSAQWDQALMYLLLLFGVSIVAKAKWFGKTTEVRHSNRAAYCAGVFLFFCIAGVLQNTSDLAGNVKGLIAGAIASIPLYLVLKRNFNKRLQGSTVVVSRGLSRAVMIPLTVAILVALSVFEKQAEPYVGNLRWIYTGGSLAVAMAFGFLWVHIRKAERKRGSPIVEVPE